MSTVSPWLPILRRRGIPVLFYSLISQGYRDAYYEEVLGLGNGLGRHRYLGGWVVIHSEDADRFKAGFLPRLQDPSYVDFFLRQCETVADSLIDFGKQSLDRGIVRRSRGELLLEFSKFCSLSVRVMPFLNTMVFVQEDVERRLSEGLSDTTGLAPASPELDARMQKLMSGGAQPTMTALSLSRMEDIARWLSDTSEETADLVTSEGGTLSREQLAATSSELVAQIDAYLDEYDFFGTDYYVGEPTDFGEAVEQLAVFLGKKRGAKSVDEESDDAEDLADDLNELLVSAQRLQYLREYRLEALFKSGRDCREMFEQIAQRLGLAYEELLCLSFAEIQDSLALNELSVDMPAIEQRRSSYGYEGTRILTGAALEALLAEMPEVSPPSDELIGVTAYPGRCSGVLRVVDILGSVGDVEAGDVLAAPMTMPYHVPAMARAGAILTDEGGILSHAAIVARELGVPCVVGLGSATSSFSGGTTVEVTALDSTGVVKPQAG